MDISDFQNFSETKDKYRRQFSTPGTNIPTIQNSNLYTIKTEIMQGTAGNIHYK